MRHGKALFYPEPAHAWSPVPPILAALGIAITNDERAPWDFAVAFKDRTLPRYREDPVLARLWREGVFVVNFHVFDISKTYVERIHEQAFGYGAFVNPLTYRGPAVEKSNGNYAHDGRVICCPLAPSAVQQDKVYMKEIANHLPDGGYGELRVAVVNRRPCLVVALQKRAELRFLSMYKATYAVGWGFPHEYFSRDELEALTRFCARYGLDHAELDVLRDSVTGQVFVVDVNVTPGTYDAFFSQRKLDETWSAMRPDQRDRFAALRTEAAGHYIAAFRDMLHEAVRGR